MFSGDRINKKIEKIGLVIDYLRENEDAFTSFEKWQIIKALETDYIGLGTHNHICLQIYDELGILPDSINPYKAFSNLVNQKFNIKDKHIIEIGGGKIPSLAKRIDLMQDKGTITVYDPNLYIKEEYSNIKLIKKKFSLMNNVSSADILIGLLPCGSSSTIIKSAIKYNKDFMIALCDSHDNLDSFDVYDEDLNWPYNFIEKSKDLVEKNNMGKLKVKYLKEIGDIYPIVYNDRG